LFLDLFIPKDFEFLSGTNLDLFILKGLRGDFMELQFLKELVVLSRVYLRAEIP